MRPSHRLQFASVCDLSFVNWTDLRCFYRCYCHGIAIERGKFDFVSETVAINVHDRSYIARFQPFGGDIAL